MNFLKASGRELLDHAGTDQLKDDIKKASATTYKRRLETEHDKLVKQRVELMAFDEKLRH
jgi:hypothetical protein